jgi:hypothetical protein
MGPLRKIAQTLINRPVEDLNKYETKILEILEDEHILEEDEDGVVVFTRAAATDWSR